MLNTKNGKTVDYTTYQETITLLLDHPVTLKQVNNRWQFQFSDRILPGFDGSKDFGSREEARDYFIGIVYGRAQQLAAA